MAAAETTVDIALAIQEELSRLRDVRGLGPVTASWTSESPNEVVIELQDGTHVVVTAQTVKGGR